MNRKGVIERSGEGHFRPELLLWKPAPSGPSSWPMKSGSGWWSWMQGSVRRPTWKRQSQGRSWPFCPRTSRSGAPRFVRRGTGVGLFIVGPRCGRYWGASWGSHRLLCGSGRADRASRSWIRPVPAVVDTKAPIRMNGPQSGSTSRTRRSWRCVAVCRGRELGVDLERVRPIGEAQRIVESYFSPGEQAEFAAIGEEDKELAFLRGWTRKEAILKGLGIGLAGLAAGC